MKQSIDAEHVLGNQVPAIASTTGSAHPMASRATARPWKDISVALTRQVADFEIRDGYQRHYGCHFDSASVE